MSVVKKRCVLVGILLLQFALIAVIFSLLITCGWRSESQEKSNEISNTLPFSDVYGWSQAGQQAVALAKQYQAAHIMVMDWTQASRMAWYARPHNVLLHDQGNKQFLLWYRPILQGEPVIVVNWSQQAAPINPLQPSLTGFSFCRALSDKTIVVSRFGKVIAHFDFYLCQ